MSSPLFHCILMESSCSTQAGDEPPVLPAKQLRHRSLSYRGLSVDSDCVLSPGLQPPNYNDVFESTDCHAVSCPIHQDLDSLNHQVRFLSDGTPPAIPKKRLTRTLSLPTDHVPPLSPGSSFQMHPHNFDNPLYMLTPRLDKRFCREPSGFGPATRSGTAPLLPLSQLSFDTSDEHLENFFTNFEDQDAVSRTIQHCHLLFLRDKAQNIETSVLLKEELSEKLVSPYQPQNFLLDEGSQPKTIVGTLFYSVHSPKFPGRTLGLRICPKTEKPASAYTKPQPLHVNVKHIVTYFQPTSNMKDSSLKTQAVDSSSTGDCTAAKLPCEGSNEYANYSRSSLVSTVQHLLWKGHCVRVERDLPSATLEDFVQETRCLQNMDCVLYDKRICFLLLQILQGTQHLHKHNHSAPSLIPSEILLVWPGIEKGKPKTLEGNQKDTVNKIQIQKGHLHMLWDSLGAPRVVISPQTDALPASPSIGALIQYCLNVHEGLAALYMSLYRKALLYVGLHHQHNKSVNITEMVSVLQVVLWGPAVSLLKHKGMSTMHSWLAMKRALFVMKLAEKGVDQTALDWEDFLCLQYVAFSEPETVANVTSCHLSGMLAEEWGQQNSL